MSTTPRAPLLLLVLAAAAARPMSSAAQETRFPHGPTRTPLTCTDCHTTESWSELKRPISFDHGQQTGFALSGSHTVVRCASCHIELRFGEPRLPATQCAACHVDVHLGNLSVDCLACHNTDSFNDVPGVALHMRTALPLTGTHLQLSCESCHSDDTGGAFTTLDPDCFACHRDDYESAGSIDHLAAGFPTDCAACHNTVAFSAGVAFDHVIVSNGFRLLGVHARLRCASCHVIPGLEPLFPGVTDQDCYGCHTDDFQDGHGGTGVPTTCVDCHDTETWEGATFEEHDALYFPIFQGPHAGRWEGCQTCHTVPSSFTCFNCHEHNQTAMDDKHKEIAGYVYDSNACLACHPTGRKE